jgi:CheY-like chemotaxis protein
VKGLVELHGGRVSASSAGPGRGSTFEVRLPVSGGVAPGAPEARPGPEIGAPCRILIADDNRDGADSLALVLRAYGHEVVTAYDGARAVREVRTFRPDVVLLDLGMPFMNGFEAARQIRATPEGRSVVLVAVTGWGQQKDREQTRDAGFDAHLVKPVDTSDIQHLVQARIVH